MPFSSWRSITIDHTKVPTSDQTDFAVVFAGTYSYLKTLANGGKVRNSSGFDIGFYSDFALTTKLKWETRKYTASTGAVMYYVKVPTISTLVDTVIYMAYGDPSITTDQSDKANVWDSNFKGVWHTTTDGVLSLADSTANADTLTNTGVTATTGQLDGAGSFNGTTANLNAGNVTSNQITGGITIECWVNATAFPTTGNNMAMAGKGYDGTLEAYCMQFENAGGTLSLKIGSYDNGNPGLVSSVAWVMSGVSAGTWYHFAGTFDGSSWQLFLNGVQKAQQLTSSGPNNNAVALLIGGEILTGTPARLFNGKIDEVRISNTGRSASYLLTAYNNYSSPSTFYTISTQDFGQFPSKRVRNIQAVRRASFR